MFKFQRNIGVSDELAVYLFKGLESSTWILLTTLTWEKIFVSIKI